MHILFHLAVIVAVLNNASANYSVTKSNSYYDAPANPSDANVPAEAQSASDSAYPVYPGSAPAAVKQVPIVKSVKVVKKKKKPVVKSVETSTPCEETPLATSTEAPQVLAVKTLTHTLQPTTKTITVKASTVTQTLQPSVIVKTVTVKPTPTRVVGVRTVTHTILPTQPAGVIGVKEVTDSVPCDHTVTTTVYDTAPTGVLKAIPPPSPAYTSLPSGNLPSAASKSLPCADAAPLAVKQPCDCTQNGSTLNADVPVDQAPADTPVDNSPYYGDAPDNLGDAPPDNLGDAPPDNSSSSNSNSGDSPPDDVVPPFGDAPPEDTLPSDPFNDPLSDDGNDDSTPDGDDDDSNFLQRRSTPVVKPVVKKPAAKPAVKKPTPTPVPCKHGAYRCSGTLTFQQCSHGTWYTLQCAAGTVCVNKGLGLILCDWPKSK